MVSKVVSPVPRTVRTITRLVVAYVVVVALTLVALGVLSAARPAEATDEAWGHAVVVAVLAVVLLLRLREIGRAHV